MGADGPIRFHFAGKVARIMFGVPAAEPPDDRHDGDAQRCPGGGGAPPDRT
jgi:hypothetical protein